MNYEIIQSGSSGNCIIINNLMLDCGVAYSKIKKYLKNIEFIFVSHAHTDHLMPSTVKKINFEYPNIKFVVGEQLVHKLVDLGIRKSSIYVIPLSEQWFQMGNLIVRVDYLYHDTPNYCLHFKMNGMKMIYAVDTSQIKHIEAKNYDYAWIEANYLTDEELDNKIKEYDEKGEFTHLKRVKKTHLSQLDALNWLQKNNIENYRFIHVHEERENND